MTYVQGIPSIDAIVKRLAAQPAQIEKALKRAIAATTRWGSNEARSGIAKALRIRITALKGRVRIYIRLSENVGKGWFGLTDLPSARLNPIQTATGARMDGMAEMPHAFVQRMKNGRRLMMIRETKARFPIQQVKLPIREVGMEVLETRVFPRIEAKLNEEFEKELNWELSK